MDITLCESSVVDSNKNLLIHFFYSVFGFDYRAGLFTDQSSVYDLSDLLLSSSDNALLKVMYYKEADPTWDYFKGKKFYYDLRFSAFESALNSKIASAYNIDMSKYANVHLLPDIVSMLHQEFPNRAWDQEVVFISRRLDLLEIAARKLDQAVIAASKPDPFVNVVPLRSVTSSKEEILSGFNPILISKTAGISLEEAIAKVEQNRLDFYKDKKFEPI